VLRKKVGTRLSEKKGPDRAEVRQGVKKYLAPGGAKNNLTRGSALVLQVAVCWNSQMQLRKKPWADLRKESQIGGRLSEKEGQRGYPSRGTAGGEEKVSCSGRSEDNHGKRIGSCTAGSSVMVILKCDEKNLGLTSGRESEGGCPAGIHKESGTVTGSLRRVFHREWDRYRGV
jgi:hypothetical protein